MEETSWFMTLMTNSFARGLLLGLFFCMVIYVRGFMRRRQLSQEITQLRRHLHTKLEIDSAENERRKKEIEILKQERDNLRITVQSLNQKPGRKEIRQYYIYQTALDIMFEKAPGFAPAWQITVKEAEGLFEKSERGVVPLLKRLMPTSPDKQVEEYEKISRLSLDTTLNRDLDDVSGIQTFFVMPTPSPLDNIAIVLMGPKFPENIGAAARSAWNMGLSRLIVVTDQVHDYERMTKMATHKARHLIETMEIHQDLGEALAPLLMWWPPRPGRVGSGFWRRPHGMWSKRSCPW